MTNSHGNTNRDIRKWLRKMGVQPSVRNVEAIQREVSRTQSEDEAVTRRAVDSGEAEAMRKAKHDAVKRDLERKRRGR